MAGAYAEKMEFAGIINPGGYYRAVSDKSLKGAENDRTRR
jgi:hypothetical protein